MHPTTLKVFFVFLRKKKEKRKRRKEKKRKKAEIIANAYATNFKKIQQKHPDSIRRRNNCQCKKAQQQSYIKNI